MPELQTIESLRAEVSRLTAELARRDNILASVANDDSDRAIELIQDGTPWALIYSWRDNGWHPLDGMGLIQAERTRQMEVEGWSLARDVSLYVGPRAGELERAADCYREADEQHPRPGADEVPEKWPWAARFWKPSDGSNAGAVRDLVKAGALYLAQAEVYQAHGDAACERRCQVLARMVADDIDHLLKEVIGA